MSLSEKFRGWPIATKLRLLMTGVCLAVIALTCGAFGAFEWNWFRQETIRTSTTRAQILAVNTSAALAFDSPKDAKEILAALKIDPEIAAAVIFDTHDQVFARYAASEATVAIAPLHPSATYYEFQRGRLIVWVPVAAGGTRLGTLAIQRSLQVFYQQLEFYGLIALGVMLGSGLVAYWLSNRMQRFISEPVLALTRAAQTVAERNDFSARAPRGGLDEIGVLTESFNTMLVAIDATQAERARLYAQIQQHAAELERRVEERTRQLQNANQELEAFGSSVSHDLRGPLRHIMGYAQILVEDCGPQLPAQAGNYLNKILKGVRNMEQLINALLEFSRLSKKSLVIERVDLEKIAREVLAELAPELEPRSVEVQIGPLPTVQGDPVLLHQVLANLIGNAVKYTRRRQRAVIALAVTGQEGELPIFSIQDNGVGFDMADQEKLFTLFERLHDASEFEGTGVGLATVQRVIQRHGGRIWAQSQPDAGATFFFTLHPSEGAPPLALEP
jgi:signal transduction histidine kinase